MINIKNTKKIIIPTIEPELEDDTLALGMICCFGILFGRARFILLVVRDILELTLSTKD